MMRAKYKKSLTAGALVAFAIVFASCQTDGPEFLVGDTRIIEGTLAPAEESQSDFFAVTRTGTVNILLSNYQPLDPETGNPWPDSTLGVSIGQPNPENQDLCRLTFSQTMEEGNSFSVYYRDGLYCISVFRLPGVPQGHVIHYTLTLTGAFS